MPIFQPRNRVQILREMAARVVGRSKKLAGLTRNSVVFHALASAANEDSEQYVQMARLRELFSIDAARGSDLDERAKEILPGTIRRRPALFTTGPVIFSRPGTTGTITIPAGSQVGAQDSRGQIRFRTTAAATILAGNTTSGLVNVVATVAGVRGNVVAGQINQLVTRIPGIAAVTNPVDFTNGFDRESDPSFRARIKAFVQAISRGTPRAIEGFAKNVLLPDGRRVVFARLVEPLVPTGIVELFIDDGTGSVLELDDRYAASFDTFVTAAAGGETDLFTTERPIRDDGGFLLQIDTGSGFVAQTRGVSYALNPASGQIELLASAWPSGLPPGASVRANYRFYVGLIRETQRVVDGDPMDPLRVPGVRPAGIQVRVLAPASIAQSLVAQISVLEGFDVGLVSDSVRSAIQEYINTLDIGDDVIVSEIVERAMSVPGMYNFTISSLTGSSPPADQVILNNQVARITSASITLT